MLLIFILLKFNYINETNLPKHNKMNNNDVLHRGEQYNRQNIDHHSNENSAILNN